MRWLAAIVLVIGCGGAPELPARLEEVANLPQSGQPLTAAFDADDTLVFMDGNTGLRRLVGPRLVTIPNGQAFSFGTMCTDRDGAIVLGSFNTGQLARLEPDDLVVFVQPQPPVAFERCAAVPSGAYHVLPFGAATTLALPPGGGEWVDSMRGLDRTLRAPDGTVYAFLDGDVVTIDAADQISIVASCAEFAGGLCPNLEFGGVDGAGHVHMSIPGLPDVHVLDPTAGTYRDIALPGALEVVSVVTGPQHAVVLASDPDRQDERSLWLLADGSDQLLRFASLGSPFISSAQLLVDRAGATYVISAGKLHRIVIGG